MTVVVINPNSGGGRAQKKWLTVKAKVENLVGPYLEIYVRDGLSLHSHLGDLLGRGHRRFIAAGGDGTVNHLLQDLISITDKKSRSEIGLGAVGLGSSNDFHKPFLPEKHFEGIPVRVDFNSAGPRDIGVIIFEDEDKITYKRYWLLNTSIGLTARANDFFNHPNWLLGQLKCLAVPLAIFYAAIRTIMRNTSLKVEIADYKNVTKWYDISNLSIVKTPHLSGNLCYDSPYLPDSGIFNIHLMHQMPLHKILFILWSLANKKFQNLSGTESWQSNSLSIRSPQPFAVEIDGEIINSRHVIFQIWNERINVCRQ